MIRGRCPTCGRAFETASLDAWPSFPFCTPRCKLIDLGRWIDEAHSIPAGPAESAEDDDRLPEDPDAGDD